MLTIWIIQHITKSYHFTSTSSSEVKLVNIILTAYMLQEQGTPSCSHMSVQRCDCIFCMKRIWTSQQDVSRYVLLCQTLYLWTTQFHIIKSVRNITESTIVLPSSYWDFWRMLRTVDCEVACVRLVYTKVSTCTFVACRDFMKYGAKCTMRSGM